MKASSMNLVRHTRRFDEMKGFYEGVLGLKCLHEWDRPGSRGAMFSAGSGVGNVTIEVLDTGRPGASEAPPANIGISFEVENADEWNDRLVAAGANIYRPLCDTPWGNRQVSVEDPDGLHIGIYHKLEGE